MYTRPPNSYGTENSRDEQMSVTTLKHRPFLAKPSSPRCSFYILRRDRKAILHGGLLLTAIVRSRRPPESTTYLAPSPIQ